MKNTTVKLPDFVPTAGLVAIVFFALLGVAFALLEIFTPLIGCFVGIFSVGLFLFVKYRLFRRRLLKEARIASGLASGGNLVAHLNHISKKETEAIEFIEALRTNNTPQPLAYLDAKNGIGFSLLGLKDTLIRYKTEETKLNWAQQGIARFSELQKEGNFDDFSNKVINYLVKYLGANQGGLFIETIDPESNTRVLELKACYAYDRKKFVAKTISEGQGMLGECMLSQETIYMTDVPKNYIHITSGLGQAIPTNIIIVPLLFNGNFYGAFEIASFHKLERYQIEFLERVSEHIAAEISTRSSVTNTEKLLSDSQELTQQLRSKEEEMRQHMEELTATQEEMNRKQSELSSVFAAINNTVASVEFDLRGNILSSNSIFSGIAGYANDVLRKMSYKSLLSEAEREKQQHEIMWQNLIDGKFFSGEFKMQNKLGEDMWLSGTFNPILDSSNAPYKIIMIAQFISQEKARQLELSSVLSATKNSVPYLEVGPNFELKSANDRFLKLFNVKRMELRDKEFSCFLAKNVNRSKLVEIVNQPYYEDYIDFAIGKEVVAYRTSFTPVRDHHNKVTKILIILSDRTQKNIEIAAVA